MKVKYILVLLVFSMVFAACSEEDEMSSYSSDNSKESFNLLYNNTLYSGVSVTLETYPDEDNTDYKNILTVYTTNPVSFSAAVFNIPDNGGGTLVSNYYDATSGDCALTATINDTTLSGGFSGTIERLSSNKLEINANHSGNTLTGIIEW